MQFVANKRWAKGVTINASYTWVPRWTENGANTTTGIGNAFVDEVSLLENSGPYFSHRKHRITASGVWELPWYRDQRSIAGYLLGGWSIAPMLVYPVRPAVGHARQRRPGAGRRSQGHRAARQEGRAVHLRRQAVHRPAQRDDGSYDAAVGLDGVRLHGAVLPDSRERSSAAPRCSATTSSAGRRFWQVDVNFAKTTPITDRVRFQVRFEAFNLFNSPMYDERHYNHDTDSADFGRINRNITGQSNFQRFVQLGFRLIF